MYIKTYSFREDGWQSEKNVRYFCFLLSLIYIPKYIQVKTQVLESKSNKITKF